MLDRTHPEYSYLDLLDRLWRDGVRRQDRTGTGTRALFGQSLRFDLTDGTVPLLTTKRVSWKTIVRELLWFLRGETNIRPLVQEGVTIWTDWPLERYRKATGEAITQRDFEARIVADADFAAAWGDLGPVYGAQWRHWPRYEPAGDGLYRRDPEGIDQIARLVRDIRANPTSRRLMLAGWNVAEVDRMALPPCHTTYQYFVAEGRLSGLLHQRSCDVGLGLPYNLMTASLLIRMLAQQCDLLPGELHWFGGDVHVYENHGELVETQTARVPKPWPRLDFARRPDSILDYRLEDFVIAGYEAYPAIAAPIAV
ncbi:thymidylate synthase [Zavarzinia compransoris]|uniref:Thymidylate synthase n=1 Tax=Zavarzinia compransoris TaxID=1264899 RepID=A0A317DY69_9PROT|nr:thymidylate synthase [Zavarzinia compransoris]PWR18880.1 thymidylate synthase [Zavarzinia compransoris]TDP48875.1 thymidylate synthase [Zavarzinia compransoris]